MSDATNDNKLVSIEPIGSFSRLVLKSGKTLIVDVSPDGLKSLYANYGVILSADTRIEVFYKDMQMSEREWRLISALLRAHPEAVERLSRYKQINRSLRLSFADICELPYRVYGGISSPHNPSLYLMHPYDFYVHKNGEHYCLLGERSMVIKCFVNYKRYSVTLEEAELPGHFVQG